MSDVKVFIKHWDILKKGIDRCRIVGDFKPLNSVRSAVTCRKIDPLVLVKEASKFKYIAKLDLSSGFYSVKVDPDSQK